MLERLTRRFVKWEVTRFRSEQDYRNGSHYNVSEVIGNLLLNTGINEIWNLTCGEGTAFDADNAFLCVGDSSTAAAATQTGPQATENYLYKSMDDGYPEYGAGQVAVWQAVFNGTEANFAWNEVLLANGGTLDAVHMNRKVVSEGTKPSGEVWVLRLTIELGNAS